MAKLNSLFKFEGTLDDVTAYKRKGSFFLRKKGGISKDRIMSDPKFARVRENNAEFGETGQSVKALRDAFSMISKNVKVGEIAPKLMKTFTQIKNMDTTSVRGERKVAIGIASAEAKAKLIGIDFSESSSLFSTLSKQLTVDPNNGSITITDLIPKDEVNAAAGSNKVGFQAVWARIHFDDKTYNTVMSNEVRVSLDPTPTTVTLTFAAPPAGTGGALILVLSIYFLQMINGQDYLLQNNTFNAAAIIQVV